MMSLTSYEKHPLVFANGVLGFQGYSADDLFCVPANGDNHFLPYGIAEGSLLIVDRTLPFVEEKLNIFQSDRIIDGKRQMKVSFARPEKFPYIGRIIMSVNLYE
ncbi:MAG: hypothetical protein NC417_14890 [Candidatus Gastranaerophilales bacterium]|nr:hypothetical protein [Candidatus Gastranaerophilales bacterium]